MPGHNLGLMTCDVFVVRGMRRSNDATHRESAD
jgi:hypothetical protein